MHVERHIVTFEEKDRFVSPQCRAKTHSTGKPFRCIHQLFVVACKMNGFCWPHCQIIIENSNIAKQALSQRRHLYLFNNIVFKTQFIKQNHNNLIVFIQNFFVFLKQLHPVMTQNSSYNVKQRSNCPKQDSDISDLLKFSF